jgi:lysophospholipase L1-like esterase
MTSPSLPLITIVFMGDSITAGQYVQPPLRWVDIVSDNLTRSYLNTPLNLQFVTEGVSGETTRQGLERFPKSVQSHRPDIVALQFGLNDCNCWNTDLGLPRVSEVAYRANLTEMIDRSRRFGARTVVISTNHTTLRHKVMLGGRTLEQQRRRYNGIVAEVASATGARLCDIDAAFDPLPRTDLENELLPYPDWLHLAAPGHKRYARVIQPVIAEAVENIWYEKQGKYRDEDSDDQIFNRLALG